MTSHRYDIPQLGDISLLANIASEMPHPTQERLARRIGHGPTGQDKGVSQSEVSMWDFSTVPLERIENASMKASKKGQQIRRHIYRFENGQHLKK